MTHLGHSAELPWERDVATQNPENGGSQGRGHEKGHLEGPREIRGPRTGQARPRRPTGSPSESPPTPKPAGSVRWQGHEKQ